MLSKSCEYAIRSVVYIALYSEGNKMIGIREIAKGLDLPAAFLAKILQTLVKENILTSTKGPNGGFFLNRSAKKIRLLDIVETIDGMNTFRKCALGLKKCSNNKPCPIHEDAKKFRDGLKEVLTDKTLDAVIKEIKLHKVFI